MVTEEPNLQTQAARATYSAARAVVPFLVDHHLQPPAAAVRPIVDDLLSRHGVDGVCELVGQLAVERALKHAGALLSRSQREGGDLSDTDVIEGITAEIDTYQLRILDAAEELRGRFGK